MKLGNVVTKIHGLPKQSGEESFKFLFSDSHLELTFENLRISVPGVGFADPFSLPEDACF